MQNLERARVMVVGCGALGNEVLKNLVLMGVGHLLVVDFDCVEMGNLTRAVLFRKQDALLSRRKVDVVKERLLELNPLLDIQTICGDIAFDVGLGLIAAMDVVMSCVDSRWARFMINRHCMRMNRPWVDGGISLWEGTVRVFMPGRNCYACNLGDEGLKELHRRMPCSHTIRRMEQNGSAPTTSIVASIIGAVAVQEAVKLIEGEETLCGKMFYYEGTHHTTRMVDFCAYDEDCPEHDGWPLASSEHQQQFSCHSTVGEILDCCGGALELRDDCFVDYVICKQTDKRYPVMLPGHLVAKAIEEHKELREYRLGDFYQHEFRVVDKTFPYRDLTLHELGIPDGDVLQMNGEFVKLKTLQYGVA